MSFLFAALVAAASPADADPSRYYSILLGHQGVPFNARTAHTWAIFARATPTADGAIAVEHFSISWLPASGNVRPLKLRTVPGKNYTPEETLALAAAHNARISYWGPNEIPAWRYAAAQEQYRYLTSGVPVYRAIDSFNLNDTTINCVHAVTHANPVTSRYIQPVIRVGEPGTSRLAARYERNGLWPHYPETADWLIPAVGLDRHPGVLVKRVPGERIPRQL
ncbi:MAG: hypothetical protein K2P78_12865 [Gemmataceae bacterium]|nr:hypothetical protein [Gemmataceae bacterium]